MWHTLPIALLLLATSAPANAAHEDAQLWTAASASGRLSRKLLASFEAISRFSGDQGRPYEAELGGFVGVDASKRVRLMVGYVFVPRWGPGRASDDEHRTRQQVVADLGALLGGRLSARIRLEQRFRAGAGTGWRLRPQLRFTRALAKDGPALVLNHESFVGLNETGWGQRSGYERMRNLAGVSIPVARKLSAEVGYLNQYNLRAGPDTIDHVASLSLAYSF